MSKVNKILDCAASVVLWGAGAIMVFVLAQVLLFASFKIPTDSMQPTVVPGDYILVV
ncbi:MAG: S26 family signal peptidase, partial [Tannerellaceae bacterium]